MRTFDVSGCTAKIVKPGMTLTAWVEQNRPFAVCNASLYDFATRVPVGTIIENGLMVHNAGNGYGCGIRAGESALDFGGPWDCVWRDYLTGYNSPVQKGIYVDPGFKDTYVFDNRLIRMAVGRKQGKTYLVTDENVNLRELAQNAIAQGFDTLVNLDGGGSRHLYYDGKTVYSSPRVPYNAIAFFKKEEPPVTETKPEKPYCPYPEPTRNLMLGFRGEDVKWLQWQLTQRGYSCGIDGIFGWQTWRATWDFQKRWSRVPDGICGPNTRRELLK